MGGIKPVFLVLLLPSLSHAGICGRPCGYLPTIYPVQCQPVELDPCAKLVLDDITERGVGNVAHLSQTGSVGGYTSGLWTGGTSSCIGTDFGFGGGGFGGTGGTWIGPGQWNGGGGFIPPNGTGNGGTVGPSDAIPEPGSAIVWALILLGVWAWVREV